MARARATDPGTSHGAAAAVEGVSATQARVMALLIRYGGLTDDELVRQWEAAGLPPASPSGLRTRRAELRGMGRVADSGQRVRLPTGRVAVEWAATA